jgi:hypothetical protein
MPASLNQKKQPLHTSRGLVFSNSNLQPSALAKFLSFSLFGYRFRTRRKDKIFPVLSKEAFANDSPQKQKRPSNCLLGLPVHHKKTPFLIPARQFEAALQRLEAVVLVPVLVAPLEIPP